MILVHYLTKKSATPTITATTSDLVFEVSHLVDPPLAQPVPDLDVCESESEAKLFIVAKRTEKVGCE